VLLSGTVTEIAVDDPLKAKKKSVAGRTTEMEIESVEEDANQKGTYLVSFTAKKLTPTDPNRNDDYMWSQSIQQRIELTDEKGNKFFCYGPKRPREQRRFGADGAGLRPERPPHRSARRDQVRRSEETRPQRVAHDDPRSDVRVQGHPAAVKWVEGEQ